MNTQANPQRTSWENRGSEIRTKDNGERGDYIAEAIDEARAALRAIGITPPRKASPKPNSKG